MNGQPLSSGVDRVRFECAKSNRKTQWNWSIPLWDDWFLEKLDALSSNIPSFWERERESVCVRGLRVLKKTKKYKVF
jgi:hypothetical protein